MRQVCFWICFIASAGLASAARSVVLENSFFRYTISADAKNVAFIDRSSGTDYLRKGGRDICAMIKISGKEYPATSIEQTRGRLSLRFGASNVRVVLKTESRSHFVMLAVESVTGREIDSLTFLDLPLKLQGRPEERFGGCALALNLITRVDALPALQTELRASCEKKFGITGAKVAIVAAPMGRMLDALKETLTHESALPICKVAGPWARDVPFNRGSYLFNFGALTETNINDWIDMAHSVGFTQIDNHGGGSFFRFGDMELNRQKWPDGWNAWQRIVSRLHSAGIGSIFHSYAFFIDKRSKYVTPVPDRRLDAFRTFTLAEPLTADAAEIAVNESTAGMTTVTGFFEHNSVVLHIDDELMTFGGVTQTAPWRFTGLKRGAFDTRSASHERGVKVRHLKECFGLLVPNPESSLFEEIAANHAAVVNHCDFDGIYLDAIDGSSILRGNDECWYWANKFVVEIQKRLKKPVGMEMSSMWHQFWQYRTRWQAWDHPQRGHKRFIDLHVQDVNGGLLLPLHLGWWSFHAFNPPQIEPTYPDVMENLGAKLIGWDAGISLTTGVDRKTLEGTPLFRRDVEILRACENLRHANAFDEKTKSKLREPGKEFALVKNAAGKMQFRRAQSHAHTATPAEPWTLSWRITNTFGQQPLRFRIEALMSAEANAGTNAVVLANLATDDQDWKRTNAAGVSFDRLAKSSENDSGTSIVATNAGQAPRSGSWLRLQKTFNPPLNLKEQQGLAVELEGDGSGALAAFRLESPRHISYGAVADRYVPLDFTGHRALTLVETESTRWSDYVWNDGKALYNVYRETINFGTVESMSIWLQNLAPAQETRCRIGVIRAVPLRPGIVKNPVIKVGEKRIEFPAELPSGSWMECNSADDCPIYGSKGEALSRTKPLGDWPVVGPGLVELEFSCEPAAEYAPRARITLFLLGDALDTLGGSD